MEYFSETNSVTFLYYVTGKASVSFYWKCYAIFFEAVISSSK